MSEHTIGLTVCRTTSSHVRRGMMLVCSDEVTATPTDRPTIGERLVR